MVIVFHHEAHEDHEADLITVESKEKPSTAFHFVSFETFVVKRLH